MVDVVDPLMRAYGAGYSAFLGEWAVTNPEFMGSVNNFALHLSLETPADGYIGDAPVGVVTPPSNMTPSRHGRMDEPIWHSLEAITTHEHVDLVNEGIHVLTGANF